MLCSVATAITIDLSECDNNSVQYITSNGRRILVSYSRVALRSCANSAIYDHTQSDLREQAQATGGLEDMHRQLEDLLVYLRGSPRGSQAQFASARPALSTADRSDSSSAPRPLASALVAPNPLPSAGHQRTRLQSQAIANHNLHQSQATTDCEAQGLTRPPAIGWPDVNSRCDLPQRPALVARVVVSHRELIPYQDVHGVGWAAHRRQLTFCCVRKLDEPLTTFLPAPSAPSPVRALPHEEALWVAARIDTCPVEKRLLLR